MPKLVCAVCGRTIPAPDHCNQPMSLDERGLELECKVCGEKKPVPRCCESPLGFWE